jgi:hypothetical protein
MTYTLRFLPAVEEDALAGYRWYEQRAFGLGEEFLRMFYACAKYNHESYAACVPMMDSTRSRH